jgi:hypothetical protein
MTSEKERSDRHYRFLHAPSPPPIYPPNEDVEARSNEEMERRHKRGRRGARRARPKSPSSSEDESEARLLRPGDEVTIIERYPPRQRDDYDWFDEDGMRVRVREI